MPKMKSKKSAAKRFRVTKTGKVKFKQSGLRHILTKKGPKRKLHLRQGAYVHESFVGHVKAMLPYAF